MPIRDDILRQLADMLAELYYDQGRIEAMVITAGLKLQQIPIHPRASDTWVFVLEEAEVQGRTQAILDRARSEKPVYEPLRLACQAYADWVTAGRPMAQPEYAPRGLLRAPPPPDTFAGRTVELQNLTKVLLQNQTAAISAAVPGMGGVGKTTLALKLASDLAPHFPGGVVWLEAGYGAGESDLVDRLARTVGIDVASEPLVEKRATILQSILANRGRVFIILDDLWDIDVGRWAGKELLPADRVLLVTSRNVALCRALCNHVQRLDVLPEGEALEFLANLLGSLGRHTEIAKELVKLLDGHPLALQIAAKRCDNGVDDLPWVVRKLQTGPTLGELKLPGQESRDTSVEASLALSYGDLGVELQQRFRALGVFAPAPFDLAGLAAVWEIEAHDEAEDIARQLVRRALLATKSTEAGAAPVYRQHMLLRAYAWTLLEQAGELESAAAHHLAYYQVLPGRQAANWQVAEAFWEQIEQGWQHARHAGPEAALSYYYAVGVFLTRRALYAAHIEWTSALLQLPAAQMPDKDRATILHNMGGVYAALGEKQQALAYYEQALSLSRQVGDRSGEATTLNNIGLVYDALGDKQQALAYYEQALLLKRQVGDRSGEAAILNNIGLVYDDLGEKQQALAYFEQALPLRRQVGDRFGEAATLNNIGGVYSDLGEKQQALAYYEQALPLSRQVGDRSGEAATLNNIGGVYAALGEKQQALAYYEQALPLRRQVGDRAGEAMTLNNIGVVYDDLGEKQQALAYFEQALPIFRQAGDRSGEATTLNNIGGVYDTLGEKQQALVYYEQALPLSRQVGDRSGEATTLNNIGLVYDALGEKHQALAYYEQALPLSRQVGDRSTEAGILHNIGLVYAALGEKQQALAYYEQALPLSRQVGNRSGEAGILHNIGAVYSDLGEKHQALAYYQQALPRRRQVGDRSGEAWTLHNIGAAYSDLGEKQQALAYYEQALPLSRQVGDRSAEAATLNNIGAVYSDLGEKQQALAYYEQALPILRQVGHRSGEASTLNNIGFIYFEQGQPDRTAQMLRDAIQVFHQIGAVAEEAAILRNLAVVIHQALGQTQEAIALVTQSITLLQHYQLPRDASGATLADHRAVLAQLQSSVARRPG